VCVRKWAEAIWSCSDEISSVGALKRLFVVYLRFVQRVSQSDVDKIGGVCSELDGMQAISVYFPGGSEEIHEPIPRPPVTIHAGPRTEPGTFRTRSKRGCDDQQLSISFIAGECRKQSVIPVIIKPEGRPQIP
jgi:hypothetical protein